MKIGVGGCSHSSVIYGHPWWYHLGEDIGAEIISSSSGASGNEKNIEKIKFIFETNPDLDLFIYEVTEPSRFVVGIDVPYKKMEEYLHDVGSETSVPYYTFNGFGNNQRIKDRFGIDIDFDKFFIEKIFTSEYNTKHKLFHTLMSIQYMADLYQKNIIFFSWYMDIHELAKECNHEKSIEKMNILTDCVEDFIINNNLVRLKNDTHLGSESHKRIYDEFLKPKLELQSTWKVLFN